MFLIADRSTSYWEVIDGSQQTCTSIDTLSSDEPNLSEKGLLLSAGVVVGTLVRAEAHVASLEYLTMNDWA